MNSRDPLIWFFFLSPCYCDVRHILFPVKKEARNCVFEDARRLRRFDLVIRRIISLSTQSVENFVDISLADVTTFLQCNTSSKLHSSAAARDSLFDQSLACVKQRVISFLRHALLREISCGFVDRVRVFGSYTIQEITLSYTKEPEIRVLCKGDFALRSY
jgi:hypothetical protein